MEWQKWNGGSQERGKLHSDLHTARLTAGGLVTSMVWTAIIECTLQLKGSVFWKQKKSFMKIICTTCFIALQKVKELAYKLHDA